jgi:hypothetical protein
MKDNIEELFNKPASSFDIAATPPGHKNRFMEKLQNQNKAPIPKNINWWRPLAIAASIAVLIAVGSMSLYNNQGDELAKLSPELRETESFFITTIKAELAVLETYKSPETETIITETLTEIDTLEKQYQELTKDLLASGNDSRVIAAMIDNFQMRITLLEQVKEMIEGIKNFKPEQDETIL